MKVQIIGQISGLERSAVDKKFQRAEDKLRDKGHEVVNPTKIVEKTTPWAPAMRACIKSLLEADAVYILEDWYNSPGARIEVMIAHALEIKEVRL